MPKTRDQGLTIGAIDPTLATRMMEIQRAAYAVEARLIEFDGIPTMHETVADIRARTDLVWRGAFVDGELKGLVAWADTGGEVDIDRLAVDPVAARQGIGRALVRTVPTRRTTTVSTGSRNHPAVALYASEGFAQTGLTEVAPGVFTSQFRRESVSSD